MNGMRVVLPLVLACAAVGCAERIEPTSVVVGDVTQPPREFFRGSPPRLEWRRVGFLVPKSAVRTMHDAFLASHVLFTDCAGTHIGASDVFLGQHSLLQSDMPQAEFDRLLSGLPEPVEVSGFVGDALFQDSERVCAEFAGGNMAGQKLESASIVVKQ
jgi:hypothetical protein